MVQQWAVRWGESTAMLKMSRRKTKLTVERTIGVVVQVARGALLFLRNHVESRRFARSEPIDLTGLTLPTCGGAQLFFTIIRFEDWKG